MLPSFQPADGRFSPYTNTYLLILTAEVLRPTKNTTVSVSFGIFFIHAQSTFVFFLVLTSVTTTVSAPSEKQSHAPEEAAPLGIMGCGAAGIRNRV